MNNISQIGVNAQQQINQTASQAQQFVNKVSNDLQQRIPNIDTKKINDAINQNANKITNSINNINKQVNNAISNGKAILNGSQNIADVVGALPDAISKAFDNFNLNTSSLTNIRNGANASLKETNTLVKTLSSNAAEAIPNPVAFVSKPVAEAVSGAATQTTGSIDNILDSISKDALDTVSKATGSVVSTASEFKNVMRETTNELAQFGNHINENLNLPDYLPNKTDIDHFLNSFTDDINDTIRGVTSTITGIADTIRKPFEIIDATIDLTKDSIDKVEQSWGDIFAGDDPETITDTVDDIISETQTTLDVALARYSNYSNSAIIRNIVFLLQNESEYSAVLDSEGNDISTKIGNNTKDDINALYKAAQVTYPEIEEPIVIPYKEEKNQFDIDVLVALSSGSCDLVEQLIAKDKNKYYDKRTTKLIQQFVSKASHSVADEHDFAAILAAVKIVGATNIPADDVKLAVLSIDAEHKELLTEMADLYKKIGIDILSQEVDGVKNEDKKSRDESRVYPCYDAVKIIRNCVKTTDIVDEQIGSDTRKLVQALYLYY